MNKQRDMEDNEDTDKNPNNIPVVKEDTIATYEEEKADRFGDSVEKQFLQTNLHYVLV